MSNTPSAAGANSGHPNMPEQTDQQRQNLCIEAVWEIEAIARTLPNLAEIVDDDFNRRLVVRDMAGRLLRLTGVLLDGLGDSNVSTEDLNSILRLDGGKAEPWHLTCTNPTNCATPAKHVTQFAT